MPKKDKHVYAFYKGEDILSIGTKKELAEALEVDIKTISYYVSNAYKDRCKNIAPKNKNHIVVVDLGEE